MLEVIPAKDRLPIVPDQRSRRVSQVKTWLYYIPSGKLGGKSKAAVLLTRVRNAMTNKFVLRLLTSALDDGTVRKALNNLCTCPSVTSFKTFIGL